MLGKAAARGIGGTVLAGGVGAIGYGVHGMSSKITAPDGDMSKYKTRFWIPGVAMLAAGHFMRRRPKTALMGAALCGAAGFSIAEGATLAYTIKVNEKAQGGAGGETKGLVYDETGAVLNAAATEAGALMPAHLTNAEVSGIYDATLREQDAMML